METRIFVVVQTKNGAPRGFEKVSNGRFFMIEEEAHSHLGSMPPSIAASYKVAAVLADFEAAAPEALAPWCRNGVYAAVEMREATAGVVFLFSFRPDGATETECITTIHVQPAHDLGLARLSALQDSLGVQEPKGGWKTAWGYAFDPSRVLTHLRSTVVGKRGCIRRSWARQKSSGAYFPVDEFFPVDTP